MKLNYSRTIRVGFAFLSISAFWQMYDNVVPLILKNTFEIGDTLAGSIMAMDNVLALFMLPIFGAISDRSTSKYGRRVPFIVVGSILTILFMLVVPATVEKRSLWLFFVSLGFTLLSISIYRSPAVALMPDVTPAPLRSKANAIINLMGALGAVFTLVLTPLLITKAGHQSYYPLFIAVALLILVSVLVVILTVPENKLRIDEEKVETQTSNQTMSIAMKRSLIFLLISTFLWFMGYNAITTAFTKYAEVVWQMNISAASTSLLIATIAAVISFIPVGILSSKLGRKKIIVTGVLLLASCFALGTFFTSFSPLVYVLFAIVGFSWACINVNSYPMVVEMSQHGDTGKFTGFYYTFSMAAQIITPIVSGAFLEFVGYWTLFPYAASMVGLALITMSFVKHGDNRPDMGDKLDFLGSIDN